MITLALELAEHVPVRVVGIERDGRSRSLRLHLRHEPVRFIIGVGRRTSREQIIVFIDHLRPVPAAVVGVTDVIFICRLLGQPAKPVVEIACLRIVLVALTP